MPTELQLYDYIFIYTTIYDYIYENRHKTLTFVMLFRPKDISSNRKTSEKWGR